jgi:hypothetical protein
MAGRDELFAALLQLADDHLILGHRVGEWTGHAPMLEEDLALTNLALDLLGQARAIYAYAAQVEGEGRDEDKLAFLRLELEYRNLLLVERPNGDFAHTILRQFYFAAFMKPWWDWAAVNSADETLKGIAGKAAKEMAYHVRHCGEWVIRLGDGTDESAARMRATRRNCSPTRLPSRRAWTRTSCRPATASGRRGTPPSAWCSTRRGWMFPRCRSPHRAGATGCMARKWVTCSPSFSTCNAPTRT